MIRSIASVLLGLAVIIVTSFGIEAAATPPLMMMFPDALPNEVAMSHNAAVLIFTFVYTFFCVVAGGYVTAWLASRSAVRHAVILGVLQSAFTIPAMIAYADKAPLWGWIVSMIVVIPAAWCGGLLYSRRVSRSGAPLAALA
jgi:hypothetical protein